MILCLWKLKKDLKILKGVGIGYLIFNNYCFICYNID